MSENIELNEFLEELYTNELKKTVLLARANGESLEEVARKLGVTRELVRRVEAKITRKFVMSHSGRKIRENLIALCASGTVQSREDLKAYCGAHGAEMAYLLRLYIASAFYDGELRINIADTVQ
jgi:hypothetical protein